VSGEPPPSRWIGVLVIAAGAIPIGAALVADDAKFNAPRWLVGMVGGLFVLAGLMLVRGSRGAPRVPEADVVGAGMGVLLTGGFTVLSVWALLFSGGPTAWSVSGSLPPWLLPSWVGAGLFYALLGVSVLLCATMSAFACRQLYRALGVPRSAAPGARRLE
jgi:hypothetical protein